MIEIPFLAGKDETGKFFFISTNTVDPTVYESLKPKCLIGDTSLIFSLFSKFTEYSWKFELYLEQSSRKVKLIPKSVLLYKAMISFEPMKNDDAIIYDIQDYMMNKPNFSGAQAQVYGIADRFLMKTLES